MEPITTRNGCKEAFVLELDTSSFFYHSTPGSYSHTWEQSTIYSRIESSAILGQPIDVPEETDNLIPQDTSRCFNCGDPDHRVSACSLPANRELIALSRQYYQFFHGTSGPQWQRIHTFESRRQQRLNWLEELQPGEIRCDLLQNALAGSNEEWLRNICAWGYPPGWISDEDPRNRVRARIWNEYDCDNDSLEGFEIHGEDDIEAISILNDNAEEDPDWETNDGNAVSDKQDESLSGKQSLDPDIVHNTTQIKRWAKYPIRYFSSELLFPYTPAAPSLLPPSWDDTSFIDTTAYLYQHYPSSSQPPPPPVAPPPLPPEPVAVPPPIPPSEPYHADSQVSIFGSESDMEVSDSE
jgi:zinc finger CCHC domain-containing protein 8